MQQRRFRPGDVLDDYCPRERRITDHAIVAMIDDHIKQTRCVVCDAEHEYKDGKAPPQRRKKPQTALFTQVLDSLQGPQPARVPAQAEVGLDTDEATDEVVDGIVGPDLVVALHGGDTAAGPDAIATVAENNPVPSADNAENNSPTPGREEGLWRRPLIRAALPRPEGQPPPQTRPAPDFTVRQPTNNRPHRHGRRRGAGDQGQGSGASYGPMRFGRGAQGQGGQGAGQGAGRARRRRGGKKNH
jgi:hypothetical protein